MTRQEIIQGLKVRFAKDIVKWWEPSAKRLYIDILPTALREVGGALFREMGARLNTASGIDTREGIEILYHFTLEEVNLIITLRLFLKKPDLALDALTPLCEAANWIEREMHEMLGVEFRGHPDLRKLLLPEEWPDKVYPLRRDYQEWDPKAIRDRGVS